MQQFRRRFATAILFLFSFAATARAQSWVEQGPGPTTGGQVEGIADNEVVGAIHAVAVHPTDANTIYAGAVNGGIWKTTNANAARPHWVEQLGAGRSLSIGAIAFDPTDGTNQTLVAGSGRFSSYLRFGGARSGLWQTTDGGGSWTLVDGGGTLTGLNISGVAPRGGTIVIAANDADSFANRGIWRLAGGVWSKISGAAGTDLPNGTAYDLASDPSDNARLYTAIGTSGIFRSTDTGATWEKVSDATMDALIGFPTNNIEIAVGSSNNVYVGIVNGGFLAGLFRSGNGGDDWTQLDLPSTTDGVAVGLHWGGQGDIHFSIAADRTNANVVYVGGDIQPHDGGCSAIDPCFPNSLGANNYDGRLFRVDASLAAGSQAAAITHVNTPSNSAPHGDSRDMVMDPNGDLIEVDDGGIYRRATPLTNAGDWLTLNGDIAVSELYAVSWDSNSKTAIAGAQDTGVPEQALPGNVRWRQYMPLQGDGADVATEATSAAGMSVRYSSAQYLGNFARMTFDAANVLQSTEWLNPAVAVGDPIEAEFFTPIAVNNVDPLRVIIGAGNAVYESFDQVDTVSDIGAIAVNSFVADPIAYGATGNADRLYIGSGADVFIRDAAGDALTESPAYPGTGIVRDIAIDPGDPDRAFVVDDGDVFLTENAGTGWATITGNLMALSPGELRSIAFSSSNAAGSVIVGADNGVFIAPGPAFDVWSALGTGMPRAIVLDLDYDAEDEVLIAALLGRGTWTISLEERDPVDVALVLDLSGSMLEPACAAGCDSRLQVLKDAVEIFVQLWTLFAIADDRMGVTYFRTSIDEFLPGGLALFPVLPNAAALIADVQGQTTVPANMTAMGGGLQTAINQLTGATRANIILFTDGMQNVNPMVNASTLEIADEAGRPDSGVDPTIPPTDLNAALGRKVSTIGVGATPAFQDLLDDIASATGGLFKVTTAPDEDLRQFYIEELIDVLRTFSPQLVGYRHGTVAAPQSVEEFRTNASARRVAFKVSWKRGEKVDFVVVKDGLPLFRAGRFIDGPFYGIFTIDVPATFADPTAGAHTIAAAGTWQVIIRGKAGTAYEVAAVVDEAELAYDFSIGGSNHTAGMPLPLQVRLELAGQPITDAQVTARMLVPKLGVGTLLAKQVTPPNLHGFAYEPGATDAQRKYALLARNAAFFAQLQPDERSITLQHAGGGLYSAVFTGTSFAGPYTAEFRVAGAHPDIGVYERTERRSVTVRFGQAVLSASDLRVVLLGRENDLLQYELYVRPVDAAGNFLGPDYGHRVTVSIDGTTIPGPPRDLLDGTYVFTIAVPDASSNVTVTVMDTPLYDGPLSGLPSAGTRRFALSAHLGLTSPLTGFPGAADDGYLAEIDFEYRPSPSFSIEGVLGHYDFGPAGAINGLTVFAKKYVGAGSWRWYGALGPGIFKAEGGGDSELGASVGAGLNYAITAETEFESGLVYSHVFEEDRGWLGLRFGVKVRF